MFPVTLDDQVPLPPAPAGDPFMIADHTYHRSDRTCEPDRNGVKNHCVPSPDGMTAKVERPAGR